MSFDLPMLLQSAEQILFTVVGTAVVGLVGVVVGLLLSRLLGGWVERSSEHLLGPGRAMLLRRAVEYSGLFLVAVFVLSLLGVQFEALATWLMGLAGVFGVALGFASQTSATNVVSGLFLLGERPFDVGDIVEVEGITGEVLSVDFLSVKLRTFDNVYVRVPNETVMKTTIQNLTRFPIRRFDLVARFPVGVVVDDVRAVLLAAAAKDNQVLNEPQPAIFFQGIVNGQVELKIVAWASREVFYESKTRFTVALVAALEQAGIDVAVPSSSVAIQGPSGPLAPRSEQPKG